MNEETNLDNKEDDVYSDEAIGEKLEADEINEVEEGFMKGYNEEESMAECANCSKILTDNVVEEELDGHSYRFCCEECARKFEEKHSHN